MSVRIRAAGPQDVSALVRLRLAASKKSAARMASACDRRKVAQLSEVRCGAGSIPASRRISQTVDAAILIPGTRSSPETPKDPQSHVASRRLGHDVLMSMEYPVAAGRSDFEGDETPVRWTVWRQDDNGNQFEVARKDSRVEAEELAAAME